MLWAWEADPEYDEPAGEKWLFLLPKRWNKHVQYAWRYAPEEGPQGGSGPPASAPRVEIAASDDEYLTGDECNCDMCEDFGLWSLHVLLEVDTQSYP